MSGGALGSLSVLPRIQVFWGGARVCRVTGLFQRVLHVSICYLLKNKVCNAVTPVTREKCINRYVFKYVCISLSIYIYFIIICYI